MAKARDVMEIRAKQHGIAGRIAPIPLNKLRSQWHVAAATGNRQADGGVSTVATWHRGGDAIETTASTWHHGGEPSGRPIQHGIRTRSTCQTG
jgi:hypothetical protein